MKHTTTRSAIAAATAAVCALAFAPAVPELATRPAERHVVLDGPDSVVADTALTLDADGRIDRTALVGGLGGLAPGANRLDARAHRDAMSTLLREAGATPFTREACVDACGEPVEPDEEYEPESFEYSYVDVHSAGDVDGDGYDDLAEATVTFGYDLDADEYYESSDVVLRSGVDAREIWSVLDAPGFFVAVPDMDGDGLDDLMSVSSDFEFIEEWSCDDGGCSDTFELRVARSFDFLRGVDGAVLSGTTLDSAFGFSFSDSTSSTGPLYEYSASDRMFADDMITELDFADGGAGHQLLIGTVSMDDSYAAHEQGVDAVVVGAGVRELAVSWAIDSLVRLLDPVTGEETVLLDSAQDGRISFPRLMRGAGNDAVLVERYDAAGYASEATCVVAVVSVCPLEDDAPEDSFTPTAMMVDLDGAVRWETDLGFGSFGVVLAGGDVDGDGVADVLDLAYDEQTGDDVVLLIGGADGAEVWSSPFVYGQATDTGLVGVDVTYREDGYDLDAVTVDGATGAITSRMLLDAWTFDESGEDGPGEGDSFTETFVYLDFVTLAGGDVDLLVERAVVEFVLVEEECWTEVDEETGEEYEYCWAFYEGYIIDGETRGHDGRDLSTLFSLDLAHEHLTGLVDVDGDGDGELFVVRVDEADWSQTATMRRLDGTVLWTVPGETYLSGVVAVPVGADLLSQRYVEGESSFTVLHEVLDGRTGSVRLEVAREVYEYGEGDVIVEETVVVMPAQGS